MERRNLFEHSQSEHLQLTQHQQQQEHQEIGPNQVRQVQKLSLSLEPSHNQILKKLERIKHSLS